MNKDLQTISLNLVGTSNTASKESCLNALLKVAKEHDFKIMDTLGENDPMLNTHIIPLDDKTPTGDEIITYDTTVQSSWIDYNGHMTESSYTLISGYAYDALARYIGIDENYRNSGLSFYTVENHGLYMQESKAGDSLYITTRILGSDAKRMHLFHTYYKGKGGDVLFTIDQMMLHVDMQLGKVAPIREDVLKRIESIKQAQLVLGVPEFSSRSIAMKP